MPGVTVGKHAIIGAASVVTHDVGDYEVAVGSPARVIKKLDSEKVEYAVVIHKHLVCTRKIKDESKNYTFKTNRSY